jgi:hypothetical protein
MVRVVSAVYIVEGRDLYGRTFYSRVDEATARYLANADRLNVVRDISGNVVHFTH